MTKKNPQDKAPKFEVKKRTPKEKPNFFQNLTPFTHPVAEILNFTVEPPNDENLDAQKISERAPKIDELGRPNLLQLGAQGEAFGRPNFEKLDAKTPKTPIRTPKENAELDAKTPKNKNLDAQNFQKTKNWVKYEEQRSTDRLSLRPNGELLRKFKVFCAEKNLNLTEFFELAGQHLISLDAQNEKDLGVLTPYDDLKIERLYKTSPFIINLFREYNKIFNSQTDWKPKDDAVGVKYNGVDLRIIELGIIRTQANIYEAETEKETKISRFKYYSNEIDKLRAVALGDETLEQMLASYRKHWKQITGREVDLSFLELRKSEKG